MTGAVYICEFPDRCEKHNRDLHGYPCHPCGQEWEAAHPLTVAAIGMVADPKVSYTAAMKAYKAAKKAEPR